MNMTHYDDFLTVEDPEEVDLPVLGRRVEVDAEGVLLRGDPGLAKRI